MSFTDIFNQLNGAGRNSGLFDQRSSSDPSRTPLVSSIGTNPDFGEKLQRQDISGSVWENLEGKGTKHYHYPQNLGTDDANHFLFIKIFQGHSEQFQIAERKVQHLEFLQSRMDEINSLPEADQEQALRDFRSNKNLFNGDFFNENQEVTVLGGPGTYHVAVHNYVTEGENKSYRQTNILNQEIISAKEALAIQESSENEEREQRRLEQNSDASRADSQSTARIRKADFQMEETISLYLPQKLNVSGMNTYDTPEFALLKDVEGMMSGDLKALQGTFIRKGAGFLDSIANIAGADLNAKRAIAAATGRVMNPRRETLFVSPEMRKFEFAFEFTPRNFAESQAVNNIIMTLRKHAYPKLAQGGYFYHMPAEFHLEYYSANPSGGVSENKWLNKILPSVLQEVNVDYTGSGQVSMFDNNAPTHINMTLSFQEVELLHQDRILEGY